MAKKSMLIHKVINDKIFSLGYNSNGICNTNSVKMPKLGFGVYQISKEECKQAVLDAIKIGYKLIDTAQSYFNEEEVGAAISECGVAREGLFITTKVWIDNYAKSVKNQSWNQ